MGLYPSGQKQIASLTGAEQVSMDNGGATKVFATTAQIAALSSDGITTGITNTNITTAGNGTLTAAGLYGGQITRTGPTGAYTDTLATAAQIVALLPEFVSGATFFIRIKNATAYTQTLGTAAGITLPSNVLIGPYEQGWYFATIGGTAASPTVTLTHMFTSAIAMAPGAVTPQTTALNTVGAGTITAAALVGGVVVRGGAQSNTAFADTTDTADNIIAASTGLVGKIGTSLLVTYQNTTDANATVGGGTGVTVSGVTVVPGKCTAVYLLTYTAASTMTMVGLYVTAPSTVSGTFVANGATPVVVADTRITANSVVTFGLKTAGGTQSAPFMTAVTPGTGFSVAAAASNTGTYNYTIIN